MDGVLVGTADGLHVLGGGAPPAFAGHEVSALAVDGLTWWAVVDGAEVWTNGSESEWAPAASVPGVTANCVLPGVGDLLVGTSSAGLLRLVGGELARVEAFDRIAGREEWFTPWGGPPDSRSMAASPGGTIYVNVHVGGIPRSEDGGRTWEPSLDIQADVHQVQTHEGWVLAATARGLATSLDAGQTWSFDTEGLHGSYCRAVAVAGGDVLVTASTGPFTRQAALYRRTLSGAGPFAKSHAGLPEWFGANVDTHCLAARDDRAALGTEDGSVFASTDGGRRWELAASGLPPVRCVALGGT